MFISEGFTFNSVASSSYGFKIVRSQAMAQGTIGENRSIVTEIYRTNPLPTFYGVKREPLRFKIGVVSATPFTDSLRSSLVSWLFVNDYKPFVSDDFPTVTYYCLPTGDSQKFFCDLAQGYAEIEFECNAPWGIKYANHGYAGVTNPTTVSINNVSNIGDNYLPVDLTFTIAGTSLKITNITDNNRVTEISELPGGLVRINSHRKQITGDIGETYEFNGNFPRVLKGVNEFKIETDCNIAFTLYNRVSY
jgi:hypothetical protein